jgi:hypothetical protein
VALRTPKKFQLCCSETRSKKRMSDFLSGDTFPGAYVPRLSCLVLSDVQALVPVWSMCREAQPEQNWEETTDENPVLNSTGRPDPVDCILPL